MARNKRTIADSQAISLYSSNLFDGENAKEDIAVVSLGRLNINSCDDRIDSVISDIPNDVQPHVIPYLQLRHNVYATQTQMIEQNATGVEFDADDVRSIGFMVVRNLQKLSDKERTYYQANDSGEVNSAAVGCVRMIDNFAGEDELPLPAQNFYDDIQFPAGRLTEASRLIARPPEGAFVKVDVIRELFRCAIAHAHQNNVREVYGVVEPGLARVLPRMGAPCEVLSDPRHVEEYSDTNQLVRFELNEMASLYGGRNTLLEQNQTQGSVRYAQFKKEQGDD